jgi:hypothetical protein
MRLSTRRSAPAELLVWLASVTSCFSDPPAVEEDTSSGSPTGEASDSASSNDATTASTTDGSADSGETTGTSAIDSGSTGEEPLECGCPQDNVFCDGFEGGLRPWLELLDGGGSATEEIDADGCGPRSARLQVVSGDTSAALAGHVTASISTLIATPHSVRALVRPDAACGTEAGFVRILEFRVPQSVRGQWYSWRIAIHEGQVRLTATDHQDAFASWEGDDAMPQDWADVRLDFDLAAVPPIAQVRIDGELVVESGNDALPLSDAAGEDEAMAAVVLGPYQTEAPFIEGCAILYDEVWVTAP